MSYPATSDFNSPDPFSAWYVDQTTGRACSGTGWGLLGAFRSSAGERVASGALPATLPGTAGGPVDLASINDPESATGWDATNLEALYAMASHYGISSEYLSAIQQDRARSMAGDTGGLSVETLQTAIWLGDELDRRITDAGERVYGRGSPADIGIPSGASLPFLNVMPPPSVDDAFFSCNVVPPGVQPTLMTGQPVVPFSFNALAVLGVAAAAVLAIVLLSKDIPIIDPKIRTRRSKR